MGLFLNLIHLSQCHTDDALDYIYKAHHDHDDGIWEPHDSPLVRRLIELFTKRGLDRLDAVKTELEAWVVGAKHVPSVTPVEKPGYLTRWSAPELELVRLYLEALPPVQWTLDDHMLAIDYVVQKYLPPQELVAEAEWLAVRAGMMGKVQSNMQNPPTFKQADGILAELPSTASSAKQAFTLTPAQAAAIDFSSARAIDQVRALSDSVAHKMRSVIVEHLQHVALQGHTGPSLESKLLDKFASLNRDWRRIAVTEAGEAQLQGLIASLKPGAKVKRIEQYRSACSFCRSIHERVMTVADAAKPDKDPDTEVWVGKNNIGRSASPKKRVGDVLIPREKHEMWQIPAGLVHPHCRGRWVVVDDGQAIGDPGLAAILDKILSA